MKENANNSLPLNVCHGWYSMAEEKLKVGFIYIGPPGDFGWTYQHDEARKELERTG